jgi:hypothetical protein
MRISFTCFYALLLLVEGEFDGKNGTASGFRMDLTFATQMCGSFFDSQKTKSFRVLNDKTLTVVPDRQSQPLWFLLYSDSYCGRV